MDIDAWLGLLLGVSLAAANTGGGYILFRHALKYEGVEFAKYAFGSMALRLLGILGAVLCILAFVPVNQFVFVAAFMAVTMVAIALEVYLFLFKSRLEIK